jgi:glutamate/tyrosine decarboxylase-like PLP-dependent enzyme
MLNCPFILYFSIQHSAFSIQNCAMRHAGGSHPIGVAADWLVSAWDQNAALHVMSPAISALEARTARWILDLLGLPAEASVGFTTGAHMANVTALAAARHEVLRRARWDVEASGSRAHRR